MLQSYQLNVLSWPASVRVWRAKFCRCKSLQETRLQCTTCCFSICTSPNLREFVRFCVRKDLLYMCWGRELLSTKSGSARTILIEMANETKRGHFSRIADDDSVVIGLGNNEQGEKDAETLPKWHNPQLTQQTVQSNSQGHAPFDSWQCEVAVVRMAFTVETSNSAFATAEEESSLVFLTFERAFVVFKRHYLCSK